jgi:3-hydroxyisobutyrate dehydrogenase-like beta-hydroxyacid dehydrogenase
MGGAMATKLAAAGFEVVLWNRDTSKAEAVASATGSRVASTAREAAEAADVVLTSLADDAAVEAVYLDEDGVVAGVGPGTVVVEMSTIDPSTVVTVGEAVDATGAAFVDGPVSGSVATVEAGALTIMAGGDAATIESLAHVFEPISARVIATGGRGSGAATKLAINALVHGLNLALAESLVLAEKSGVDRATAYEVFVSGATGAPFVAYKRDAYENPDDAPVAFSLDLVAKDLRLITGLAERVGAPMGQAATSLAIVEETIEAGMGDLDMSAIAIHLREDGS